MNKITIMGNLGRNPELRKTQSGKDVCSFSVATTEKYNNETQTQWHNVVFWGKQAEIIAKYFFKGSKILLTGKMTYRSYNNAAGEPRNTAEIVGSEFHFIDKAGQQQGGNYQPQPTQQQMPQQQPAQGLPLEDDLPF